MKLRYPNLFIIGAPKCGTTALNHWLKEHPEIFVPYSKEPHYFSSDYCLTPDLSTYLAKYRSWAPKQKWAIDSSVWYLYSPTAIPRILEARPDARFVVMLRNPLEMIPSMHQQQIFNGNELELDLESALSLNDIRLNGVSSSVYENYPADHLAYYHSCALGHQIKRLLDCVDEQQLHIILQEDLSRSPKQVLQQFYDFLNLEPAFPPSFDRVNQASARRFQSLDRFAKSLGNWKSSVGIPIRFGILSWLRRVNEKKQIRQPLTDELRNQIKHKMSDDISLLSDCINRDLSHW